MRGAGVIYLMGRGDIFVRGWCYLWGGGEGYIFVRGARGNIFVRG